MMSNHKPQPAKRFGDEVRAYARMETELLEMDIVMGNAINQRARRDSTTNLVMTFLTGFMVGVFAYFLYINLGLWQ